MEVEKFIDSYSREIEQGTAAIFAGAGLSVPAGCVDWRSLLRDIAEEMGIDVEREPDLTAVAQYHVNRNGGNRGHLNRAILEELTPKTAPTKNHRLLARLPIETWWTTNYDKLIETALSDEGRTVDVKFEKTQLAHTKPRRDSTVYKMHGDIDHPASAVLTRDDYERYEINRGPFLNALNGDLVSKTFLFIGFGFSDPNLQSVLSQIRIRFNDSQRPHYALFKKVKEEDLKDPSDYPYAKARQDLFIEDLKRFHINAVMIENYSDIEGIIDRIYKKFVAKYIFVSTSAADFQPWGEEAVQRFMAKIGSLLTERGFRIVSGLGLGTGNALISGAIQAIASSPIKRLDEDILLRPFPQFIQDEEERDRIWKDWRRDMLTRSGLTLFLFGNKLTQIGVVPATGMLAEYELALEIGVPVLPIGATGSISRHLFERSIKNSCNELAGFSDEIIEDLKLLANPSDDLDHLLGPILDMISKFKA